eukprot:112220-Prorocentrum_minimum.AAC.8
MEEEGFGIKAMLYAFAQGLAMNRCKFATLARYCRAASLGEHGGAVTLFEARHIIMRLHTHSTLSSSRLQRLATRVATRRDHTSVIDNYIALKALAASISAVSNNCASWPQ